MAFGAVASVYIGLYYWLVSDLSALKVALQHIQVSLLKITGLNSFDHEALSNRVYVVMTTQAYTVP